VDLETSAIIVVDEPGCQAEASWPTRFARRVERHRFPREDVAFSIDHLDQHFVLATRHARQNNGVALAEIRPQPGQVVDGDVQMANADTLRAAGPATGWMRKCSTRQGNDIQVATRGSQRKVGEKNTRAVVA
jgi:hypothetical protein